MADFEGNRLKASGAVPVLFYAQWCPFCRSFYPQFKDTLASRGIPWAEADISDMGDSRWETFEISVVPTIIIFEKGLPVFRKDGVLGRGLSQKALEETIAKIEALKSS